jgi:hypothetical protein
MIRKINRKAAIESARQIAKEMDEERIVDMQRMFNAETNTVYYYELGVTDYESDTSTILVSHVLYSKQEFLDLMYNAVLTRLDALIDEKTEFSRESRNTRGNHKLAPFWDLLPPANIDWRDIVLLTKIELITNWGFVELVPDVSVTAFDSSLSNVNARMENKDLHVLERYRTHIIDRMYNTA